jgi:hypothetical protein
MDTATYDRPEGPWDRYDDQPPNEGRMPGRPRRKYFTRASAALAALVVGAIGFYVGVRVEKSQVSSSSGAAGSAASAFANRARALASGGATGGTGSSASGSSARGAAGGTGGGAARGASAPGAGGGASFGTVSSVHGDTLYVSESSGNTVKIKLASSTKISKSLSVRKKSIRPGDTVVVQGLSGKNGTVTAASVSDSGTGSSAIRGLFGGGGAGGTGGSGGSGGSGGKGGSGGGSGVSSLFSSGGGG